MKCQPEENLNYKSELYGPSVKGKNNRKLKIISAAYVNIHLTHFLA